MQRLFSVFPRGWPGIALLLLRLSVAATSLRAYTLWETSEISALFALIPLCTCLCFGALTPLAAALALALQLVAAAMRGYSAGLVMTIVDATALALLGPGAYSLDALRFGRRVIIAASWRHRDFS